MNLDQMIDTLELTQAMLTKPFSKLPKKSRNKAINELARSYRVSKLPLSVLALKLIEASLNQKKIIGCITRDSLHKLSPFENEQYPLFLKQLRSFGIFKIVSEEKGEVKIIELIHPLFRGYLLDLGVDPEIQLKEAIEFAKVPVERKASPAKERTAPSIVPMRSESFTSQGPKTSGVIEEAWQALLLDLRPFLDGNLTQMQEVIWCGDGKQLKKYKFASEFLKQGIGAPISFDKEEATEKLLSYLNPVLASRFKEGPPDWCYDGTHCKAIREAVVASYGANYHVTNPANMKDPLIACVDAEYDLDFIAQMGIEI